LQEGSLAMSLERLAEAGIRAADVAKTLEHAYISAVLTAHPTEVQRKSILDFVNDDISFDGLIAQGAPPQIDSDSNGSPCYASSSNPSACKAQIGTALIGVYQRLAWRNDGLVIDGDTY